MSEEEKKPVEETKEECCKFICVKCLKKFCIKFLAVYLGVLLAMCTFAAMHKSKMPNREIRGIRIEQGMHQRGDFQRGEHRKFQPNMERKMNKNK